MTPLFDYERWEARQKELHEQYRSAAPFPSIALDNFLSPDPLKEVVGFFPSPSSQEWTQYRHYNSNKMAQTKRELLPPAALRVIDELNGPRFIRFLAALTGVPNLIPDPSLEGGGLHQSTRGGFLNIHADFTAHPFQKNWARRVNVLVYLNEGWEESYGGHLQLWDKQAKRCVRKILPVFNRCVVFSTDPDSFHGHPEPTTCPPGMTRKSIALYYFTEEKERIFVRSTEYRAKPDDPLRKKAFVYADKLALRGFDFFKRKLGISDDVAARILRRIFK